MKSRKKKDFEIIDAFFLILGIIVFFGVVTAEQPKNLEYIPDVIRGLTTLASILVAFTGFYLSYAVSTAEEEETKKWLKRRTAYITVFIGIALLILISAYGDLVHGTLFNALKTMYMSVFIIAFLFLDTIIVLLDIGESKT